MTNYLDAYTVWSFFLTIVCPRFPWRTQYQRFLSITSRSAINSKSIGTLPRIRACMNIQLSVPPSKMRLTFLWFRLKRWMAEVKPIPLNSFSMYLARLPIKCLELLPPTQSHIPITFRYLQSERLQSHIGIFQLSVYLRSHSIRWPILPAFKKRAKLDEMDRTLGTWAGNSAFSEIYVRLLYPSYGKRRSHTSPTRKSAMLCEFSWARKSSPFTTSPRYLNNGVNFRASLINFCRRATLLSSDPERLAAIFCLSRERIIAAYAEEDHRWGTSMDIHLGVYTAISEE